MCLHQVLLIRKKPAEAFTSCAPKLSDALEKYCRLKGGGRAELFSDLHFVILVTSLSIWVIAHWMPILHLMPHLLEIGLLVGDYHHHLSGEYSRRSVLSLR